MAQKKYVVKSTDNPLTLAKKFGVPASKLLQANGLVSLTPGQTLKVPASLGSRTSAGGAYQAGPHQNDPSTATYNPGGNVLTRTFGPLVNPTKYSGGQAQGEVGMYGPIQTGNQNVTINGVRIPANTTFQPGQPQAKPFNIWDAIINGAGAQDTTPAIPAAVKGALPGEAQKVAFSPSASTFGPYAVGLGANGQVGGVSQQPFNPYTGSYTGNQDRSRMIGGVPTTNPFSTIPSVGAQGGMGAAPLASTQDPLAPNQYSTPRTYGPPTPITNQGSFRTPAQGTGSGLQPGQAAASGVARPSGVYTGGNDANSQAWRAYWNDQAAHPTKAAPSPYIPTRSDVWNAKAAARKRANNSGDGQAEPQARIRDGGQVNQSLTWRI
jgi:LysM repeat protein